jgi:DNA-binding GntR family transcriptional regulator
MNQDTLKIIRDRILFLEYAPGRILNEAILAGEFGVSKSPLSKVLNRLEWEQLVRIIPRTGTMVTEIEFHKMMHAYQVRLEVEALAGRLAAEQITDDHLHQIDKIREDCSQLFGQNNRKALVNIDFEFRKVLYDAANNPVLTDWSQYLYNLTLRVWYFLFERTSWDEEVQGLLVELERTHEALSRRDPQEAARLRRGFLNTYLERIRNKF